MKIDTTYRLIEYRKTATSLLNGLAHLPTMLKLRNNTTEVRDPLLGKSIDGLFNELVFDFFQAFNPEPVFASAVASSSGASCLLCIACEYQRYFADTMYLTRLDQPDYQIYQLIRYMFKNLYEVHELYVSQPMLMILEQLDFNFEVLNEELLDSNTTLDSDTTSETLRNLEDLYNSSENL
jgi:hypothetical protein